MKYNLPAILTLVLISLSFSLTAKADTQSEYIALADSADVCIAAERYAEAEGFILKALRLEPANYSNHLLLSNLSAVRLHLGRPTEAAEAAEIGLGIAPSSTMLLMNHALASLALGDEQTALEDTGKALEIDSIHPRALNIHGLILFNKGRYREAKVYYQRLLSIDQDDPDALVALGRIALVEGDMTNAVDYFTRAVKVDPLPENDFYLVLSLIFADKDAEASERLRESLRDYPHDGDLYILKALLSKRNFQNDSVDLNLKLAREYGADENLLQQFFPVRKK